MTREPPKVGEVTSKRVLAIAARGVHQPETLTLEEIRTVCASALTQAPDKDESNGTKD